LRADGEKLVRPGHHDAAGLLGDLFKCRIGRHVALADNGRSEPVGEQIDRRKSKRVGNERAANRRNDIAAQPDRHHRSNRNLRHRNQEAEKNANRHPEGDTAPVEVPQARMMQGRANPADPPAFTHRFRGGHHTAKARSPPLFQTAGLHIDG
jgi:hypothetical protein